MISLYSVINNQCLIIIICDNGNVKIANIMFVWCFLSFLSERFIDCTRPVLWIVNWSRNNCLNWLLNLGGSLALGLKNCCWLNNWFNWIISWRWKFFFYLLLSLFLLSLILLLISLSFKKAFIGIVFSSCSLFNFPISPSVKTTNRSNCYTT